jgi:tRNA-binding protein
METITWNDFEKVQLVCGTIVEAEVFQEARKPAYKLKVDLGKVYGIKKSSAQITKHYIPEELVGKQVMVVLNFPEKQIGPIISQILVTGFADDNGDVVLAVPDKLVPNGSRLH